jgi:hypothetical protein
MRAQSPPGKPKPSNHIDNAKASDAAQADIAPQDQIAPCAQLARNLRKRPA